MPCARVPSSTAPLRSACGRSSSSAVSGPETVRVYALATVVNFPGGEDPIADVVALVERSLAAGADEIDVVIPWRSVLQGDTSQAIDLLAATRRATGDATMKVILESGAVADADTVRELADLAIDGGADFLKTSTGKTARGATLEAAATMLGVIADAGRVAGRVVGLKPSGGIRTFDDAEQYLALADGAWAPAGQHRRRSGSVPRDCSTRSSAKSGSARRGSAKSARRECGDRPLT